MGDVKYAKFRVGDLFEKLKFKKANPKFLSKERTAEYSVPVVYAKKDDNGIMYWGRKGDFTTYSNVLSVVYNGAISAGMVYAQPFETGIRAESYFIRVRNVPVAFETNLYLATVLEKVIYPKYSRDNLATWSNKVENDVIELPVTSAGTPDWDYMAERIAELEAERIAELEAERIAELEAYLVATGLDDCELTDEDREVLSREVDTREFRVGELFDIHPTKAYKLRNAELFDVNGNNPVVTNSSLNNGLTGYTNRECTEHGNMITFSDTTTSDAIFYQPDDFVGYSHIQGLYPVKYVNEWDEKTLLYVVACMRKSADGRFSYATKFTRAIASNMCIELPVVSSGTPDWEYMRAYTRAQEKIVIKNAVELKDEIIAKTKQIVSVD